jgi:hypothetical protein
MDSPCCDEFFEKEVKGDQLRNDFAELPQFERKKIVLSCLSSKKDCPMRWIQACVTRWKQTKFEQTLNQQQRTGQYPASNPSPMSTMSSTSESPAHGVYTGQPGSTPTLPSDFEPAAWAHRWATQFPNQKSALLRTLYSELSQEVSARIRALPSTDAQLAIGYCLSLAASATPGNANRLASKWLDRAEQFGGATSLASALPPAISATSVLRVLVVYCGAEATLMMSLASCVHKVIAKQGYTQELIFLPPIFICQQHVQSEVIGQLAKKFQLPNVSEKVTTLNQLVEHLKACSADLGQIPTKVCFASFLSEPMLPTSVPADREKDVLHTKDARWIFEITSVARMLRGLIGLTGVLEICFAPPSLPNTVVSDLEMLFGGKVTYEPCWSAGGAVAIPTVFCTPAGVSITHAVPGPANVNVVNEWTWPNPDSLRNMPGRWPTIISEAVEVQIFNERVLSPTESTVLSTFVMRRESETRFCQRDFYYHHMGFPPIFPMRTWAETEFRCFASIDGTTGGAYVGAGATPCGTVRWCLNCDKLFKLLEHGFRLDISVNILLSLFVKILTISKQPVDEVSFAKPAGPMAEHKCSPQCPQNPCIGL